MVRPRTRGRAGPGRGPVDPGPALDQADAVAEEEQGPEQPGSERVRPVFREDVDPAVLAPHDHDRAGVLGRADDEQGRPVPRGDRAIRRTNATRPRRR